MRDNSNISRYLSYSESYCNLKKKNLSCLSWGSSCRGASGGAFALVSLCVVLITVMITTPMWHWDSLTQALVHAQVHLLIPIWFRPEKSVFPWASFAPVGNYASCLVKGWLGLAGLPLTSYPMAFLVCFYFYFFLVILQRLYTVEYFCFFPDKYLLPLYWHEIFFIFLPLTEKLFCLFLSTKICFLSDAKVFPRLCFSRNFVVRFQFSMRRKVAKYSGVVRYFQLTFVSDSWVACMQQRLIFFVSR